MYEHKNGLAAVFTKRYRIHRLVYFEETHSVESAILREKELKKWRRRKKVDLIKSINPEWEDYSADWFDGD
jgi:putative endonuclease